MRAGFALGGGMAHRLGAGLVLVRKAGNIVWAVESATCVDWSGTEKTLEVASDAVSPADRVLVVDDWSETGGQLRTAIALVERPGNKYVAFRDPDHIQLEYWLPKSVKAQEQ